MKTFSLLVTVIFLTFIPGCSNNPNKTEPPEIRLGEDACDECRMIINEQRFAAAFITTDGKERRFDDVGCMILYIKKQNENIAHIWVSSYKSNKWLKADEAFFIKSNRFNTPMAYGIVAVGNKRIAEDMSSKFNAGVMNFKQLRETEITKNLK